MIENQKIKNTTPKEFNGTLFKSTIEVMVYKTLFQYGFKPDYEKITFLLVKGFKPTIPFYIKKRGKFGLMQYKLRDSTYTPDFTFQYKGFLIIIEVKGFANDVFPLKFKMFRKLLESYPEKCILFEVFNKKDILNTIEIINNIPDYDRENKSSDKEVTC